MAHELMTERARRAAAPRLKLLKTISSHHLAVMLRLRFTEVSPQIFVLKDGEQAHATFMLNEIPVTIINVICRTDGAWVATLRSRITGERATYTLGLVPAPHLLNHPDLQPVA